MKSWFYGIYGIGFVWRGSWADPELIWHKKSFNYYDLENSLWELYREDCRENARQCSAENFETWVKKNAFLAREILQNLMDYKCFYGT